MTVLEIKPTPSTYERTRVSFESEGLVCAGVLYRPAESAAPIPCVVMANGMGNTMDVVLPAYAERFVAAGFAVLLFDFRYLGESQGEPRQLIVVERQREDLRAAVRFARSQPGIDPDRIALWGTSLGGGHAFSVAVEDPRIAAVITQVPFIDVTSPEAKPPIEIPPAVVIKTLVAAVRDTLHSLLGLPPYYMKMFGRPEETAAFRDPVLMPRVEALMKASPTWRNQFTPRFYLATPRYQSGSAEKLRAPLLMCVADREVYSNPEFQAKIGHLAPRGEVRRYDADHFDFYHGMFDQVIADEIEFLKRHLANPNPPHRP